MNQALATRGHTGDLGSGLNREEMAPGKVKDRALGNARAPWRSLILRLRRSVHLFPALAPLPPSPGTKNGLAGPPFQAWGQGGRLILLLLAPPEYPAPTEVPLISPGDLVPNLLRPSSDCNASLDHWCWLLSPRLW